MAISQRLVDPHREVRVPTGYSWQDSYSSARLETDWTKMVELVQAAESEIHKRRLELSKDHNGTQEEREAAVNALNDLRVLRMDAAAWGERQNLVGTPQPNSSSTLGTPR
jgi:seryl-tRNA(Sec) selenium transferase